MEFGRYGSVRARIVLAFVLLGILFAGTVAAQGISREQRLRMLESVVEVRSFDIDAGLWMHGGSGTIVSPDGYVLTNYHVVGDLDIREHFEWAGIFMTSVSAPDVPPKLAYWARYLVGDPALDLAVLQIVEYADETPVEAGRRFPAMPVGDSNTLLLGDTLTVVGYPGISGSTITFTQGIMSGWLGEDTLSGGKQWIKTDAKIARGNSGGAAFNQAGELVGIPTLGVHTLDGQLYEEQVMIRPVALAWALLGPHVPNVLRATSAPGGQLPPESTGVPGGQPSGRIGGIVLGGSVTGIALAVPESDSLVYHTYVLDVPSGTGGIVLTLNASAPVGLAGKFGAEILTYEDVDFTAPLDSPSQRVELDASSAGELWIDVVHSERGGPVEYTLSAVGMTAAVPEPDLPAQQQPPAATGQSGQASQAVPVGPGSPMAPGQAQPDTTQQPATPDALSYPAPTQFGTAGTLQSGIRLTGNLLQSAGVSESTYHTYTVDVPSGTAELTIELAPVALLDLAIKHGSEIMSYANHADGGDWHYAAIAEDGIAPVIVVQDPAPGLWYVDVINWENATVDGRYSLVARLR